MHPYIDKSTKVFWDKGNMLYYMLLKEDKIPAQNQPKSKPIFSMYLYFSFISHTCKHVYWWNWHSYTTAVYMHAQFFLAFSRPPKTIFLTFKIMGCNVPGSYIRAYTHPYKHTHAHTTFMSTSERLSRHVIFEILRSYRIEISIRAYISRLTEYI